ncbi:MAG TPA: hypothetical protein DD391_07415 [Clostridiales bacterium]|nr:hypothetical protein [Clostridiales bacterium]HBL82408.1 hypothetical protein [Clostridiales bacterium]
MNIHEKVLKIAEMAGVLRKNKAAYNFKYTPEDEIQAKVTAGMKKYGVLLVPSIVPGSLHVEPFEYEKYNKITKKMEPAKEIMVWGDMVCRWYNTENPKDVLEAGWVFAAQKDDISQALGGALTYSNRYYLMKTLQLATVEDDPDNYRSKQRMAEDYERETALRDLRQAILDAAAEKIKAGADKEAVYKIIADNNGGRKNPNTIKSTEEARLVLEQIESMGGNQNE